MIRFRKLDPTSTTVSDWGAMRHDPTRPGAPEPTYLVELCWLTSWGVEPTPLALIQRETMTGARYCWALHAQDGVDYYDTLGQAKAEVGMIVATAFGKREKEQS